MKFDPNFRLNLSDISKMSDKFKRKFKSENLLTP